MALLKKDNINKVVSATFIEIKNFDKHDLKGGNVVIFDDSTVSLVIPPEIAKTLTNNANSPMEKISFFYFPEGRNTERFSWIRCSDYKDTFPLRVGSAHDTITHIFSSNIDLSKIKGNKELRDLFFIFKLDEPAPKFIRIWG